MTQCVNRIRHHTHIEAFTHKNETQKKKNCGIRHCVSDASKRELTQKDFCTVIPGCVCVEMYKERNLILIRDGMVRYSSFSLSHSAPYSPFFLFIFWVYIREAAYCFGGSFFSLSLVPVFFVRPTLSSDLGCIKRKKFLSVIFQIDIVHQSDEYILTSGQNDVRFFSWC